VKNLQVAKRSKTSKHSKHNKDKQTSTAKSTDKKPIVKFDFDTFQSTAEVPTGETLVNQIIGQERGVNIIKKAARQKRNVLLIGTPGTGKSMLAQAMAELMPVEELEDILVYQNPGDENAPIIKVVKAGEGKKIIQENKFKHQMLGGQGNIATMLIVMVLAFILLFYGRQQLGDVITAAMLIGLFVLTAAIAFASQVGRNKLIPGAGEQESAKLLVDNSGKKKAPFVDGTGARAGALLGDCRHDPLQSILGKEKVYFVKISSRKAAKGKITRSVKLISFEKFWESLTKKHPSRVEQHSNNYEAIVIPRNEKIYTLGYQNGKVIASRIYSLNRYFTEKETIQLTAPSINLTLTSDHKLITKQGSTPARRTKVGQQLITLAQ